MKLILPEMGEGVIEATVSRWLVKVGDVVGEMEPVVEVETDKVTTEVVADAAGTVTAILVEEGATVDVGTVLAQIALDGEDAEPPEITEPVAEPAAVSQNGNGAHAPSALTPSAVGVQGAVTRQAAGGRVSPVVARMAAEHDLDLSQVTGTGLKGRITKRDVEAFLQTGVVETQTPPPAPVHNNLPPKQVETHSVQPAISRPPAPSVDPAAKIIKLTPMRRSIAEHMVHSVHTSPHATTVHEVDFSAVAAHRKAHKTEFASKGVKLTFTAYMMLAVAEALGKYPLVNSSWHVADDGTAGIALHPDIHIGMATAVQDGAGLVVPVIKHAADYNLLGMARTVNELANKARNNQLAAADMQGGTFTVTNHGVSGSLFATPIINQPQAAILGVGAIKKQMVIIEDEYGNDVTTIRPLAYLSCSFDHRILDGVSADNFVAAVRHTLETWRG